MRYRGKSNWDNWLLVLVAFFAIGAGLTVRFSGGFTDPKGATRTLVDAGYTDIEITGYRWLGGSDSDTFRTGFKATSPTGKRVSGIVCSGWFKGYTIRFD